MADDYVILSSNRTVDVRSATLVEDVEEIFVKTKPSGATFVRLVPYAAWEAGGTAQAVEPIVQHIEHIFAVRPHVKDANAVQSISAAGLITNSVEFIVRIDPPTDGQPGPFQATVTIPVQVLHDQDSFDGYFKPVLDALYASANL